MTRKDKDLLIRDLCARLPYNVRVKYHFSFSGSAAVTTRYVEGILNASKLKDFIIYPKFGLESTRVSDITPYLRPMSSMTKDEEQEFQSSCRIIGFYKDGEFACTFRGFDWLNAHHFDYRGLIEKGLALEAPEGMY